MNLTEVKKGQTAVVTEVMRDETGHWRKLFALGLSPGAEITVVQRWPTVVLQIGMAQVAVDSSMAKMITVELAVSRSPRS